MALKKRLERVKSRLPKKRKPFGFSWVIPETGEAWYSLRVTPVRKGRGWVYENSEKWDLSVLERARAAENSPQS